MLALDKIDSSPIAYSDFDYQFLQWIWVLVDTLNENLGDISAVISSINPITGTTQAVESNSSYIVQNDLLTTITLPELSPVGARISIAGFGAAGWVLIPFPASGQTIKVASVGGSASVSITSASRYDSIEIICVEANLTWVTVSDQTTGFVIV